MGADYYESEEQVAATIAAGGVPIGIGENTVISNAIVDKNARIGKNVKIVNKEVGAGCVCRVRQCMPADPASARLLWAGKQACPAQSDVDPSEDVHPSLSLLHSPLSQF